MTIKLLRQWVVIVCCIVAQNHVIASATGTIKDVQHVVIFMQENRSFDEYFGSLRGVRGFNDRNALIFASGKSVFYQPRSTTYLLPFHSNLQCITDLDHSWNGGHQAWNAGNWDQWVAAKGSSTMSFYTREDLPFHYALADAYTICDAYHCSVLGLTNPNRLYLWTGMIDPRGTGGGPIIDNSEPAPGFTWTTYPERLQAAGVSWKVYQQADNFDDNALAWFAQYKNAPQGSSLRDRGVSYATDFVAAFQSDVTKGTLPKVSWLIAPTAQSEHPPFSPASGAALTKRLLDVLASNPTIFNSTAFILNFDENDGFFDHVPPPVPPVGTPDEFVAGAPIGLGVRVPMLIVSPWTRGGYVCSEVFDHTSIIRFLETWTGVAEPNISAWRRTVCGDLTSAFDFKNPDFTYPTLPSVAAVNCGSNSAPAVPNTQTFPIQESGTRPARPLAYQPNASSSVNCSLRLFSITMTNQGTVGTHFSIYPRGTRVDTPRQYTVAPGLSATDSFSVSAGTTYDFTCYGPNGFQRRFAGNLDSACGQLDVVSAIDPDLGLLILHLQNFSSLPVTFFLNDTYGTGASSTNEVEAGRVSTFSIPAVTQNNGWYDLSVTTSADATFIRRLAGRIEIGAPKLSAMLAPNGSSLTLRYPAWAQQQVLETSSSLNPNSWTTVTNSVTTTVDNRFTVTLHVSSSSAFFRLRQ